MKVGIAFDLAPASGPPSEGPDDRYEEFDKPETVDAIAEVIRGEGHEVVLLGDGRPFLERVLADPPDFVWNIAEGEGVGRCREARVPAALEMLGIPYSGSDPLTLAACLDKGTTRRLLGDSFPMPRGHTVTPRFWPSDTEQAVAALQEYLGYEPFPVSVQQHKGKLRFPVILKPAFEGSSKGIRGTGLAHNEREVEEIGRRLSRDYDQEIVVEEFIAGQEVTAGVCGNPRVHGWDDMEVLGVMQIVPRRPTSAFIYSLDVKRNWRDEVRYVTPAQLDDETRESVGHFAKAAYSVLGCRDFARLDFRIDAEGHPYLIEVNPLPGLAPVTSDLVILAEGYGLSHADLIRKLFRIALDRVGLS